MILHNHMILHRWYVTTHARKIDLARNFPHACARIISAN